MSPIRDLMSNLPRCAPTGWPVLQALTVVAPQCWDGCRKSPCQVEIQLARHRSGLSAIRTLQEAVVQSPPAVHSRSRHETADRSTEVPAKPASHAMVGIRLTVACHATAARRWIAPAPWALFHATAAFRSWAAAARYDPSADCWIVQLPQHSSAADRCFRDPARFP